MENLFFSNIQLIKIHLITMIMILIEKILEKVYQHKKIHIENYIKQGKKRK